MDFSLANHHQNFVSLPTSPAMTTRRALPPPRQSSGQCGVFVPLTSISAAPSSESASVLVPSPRSAEAVASRANWHLPRPPPSKHRPSELCGGETSKWTPVRTTALSARTFSCPTLPLCYTQPVGGQGGRGDGHTGMREQSKKQHSEHLWGLLTRGAHSSTSSLFALPVIGKATTFTPSPITTKWHLFPWRTLFVFRFVGASSDQHCAIRTFCSRAGQAWEARTPKLQWPVRRLSGPRRSWRSAPDSRHTPANVLSVGTVVLRKSARTGDCCSVPS